MTTDILIVFSTVALIISTSNTLRRRKAEIALRNAELKYRTIFNKSFDCWCIINTKTGIILDCNMALSLLIERDKSEIIGEHHSVLYPPKSRITQRPDESRHFSDSHRCQSLYGQLITKIGLIKEVEIKSNSFKMDRQFYSLMIYKDITESKVREAEYNRFEAAIHHADEAVIITDPDRNIQYVNPAFERMTGFSPEEVRNQSTDILRSNKHNKVFHQAIVDTLTVGKTWHGRMVYQKKDGSPLILEATISPLLDADGKIVNYVAVERDATREAQLEKELYQAQKMEAIGTLASGVAHDFNNILFPIMGYTEMVLNSLPKESPHHDYLTRVLDGANRASELVNQILTFSRKSAHVVKPVRAQLIIKEALKLLGSSLPSTIRIRHTIDNRCKYILADPTHIHQIIMNLCTNAFHAMEEKGGVLTVTYEEVDLKSGDAPHPTIPPGMYACLSVKDTGTGINPKLIDRIYDPYFTTKEEGKGTGLGLSVIHGIVRSYNGYIDVKSEPGEGAEFKVYLPAIENSESPQDDVNSPLQRGSEHILLIDDEEAVLQTGRTLLEKLGYHVTANTSSTEALELLQATPYDFDIVITDLTMPDMTGETLASEMIKIRPDLPIILCTGRNENTSIQNKKALGIRCVLPKPIAMKDLSTALRSVLENKTKLAS